MDTSAERSSALPAIATAILVVGVLDITSAFIIWWARGVGSMRGLQSLASGLLGQQAYDGGAATASLGLALHFFVASVVVTVFYLASRRISFLTQHPFASGILYGIAVYLVMYWIVLPDAFPQFRHRPFNDVLAILIHITLIGLPTALIVRRFSHRAIEPLL